MSRKIQKIFDQDNVAKIKTAVTNAENESSGEIIPCVVQQSSHYEEVSVKAFFFSILIMAIVLVIYELNHDMWFPEFKMGMPIITTIILLAAGMFGFTAVHFLPGLRRKLLGKERMSYATLRHAKVMFLENEVFRTKNRTGILIFVSLFEHQVHVLADKGLKDKVQQEQWNEVVSLVVDGIKNGNASQGIITGIQKCGEILKIHSPATANDRNELPNDLHVGRSDR